MGPGEHGCSDEAGQRGGQRGHCVEHGVGDEDGDRSSQRAKFGLDEGEVVVAPRKLGRELGDGPVLS
eukprot:2946277-Heterocapsa_arctica.AAC.1